jgi:antitoxin PrlF
MAITKSKLTSKVTQKYQATIPQGVREKLEIEKGDRMGYRLKKTSRPGRTHLN